MMNRPLLILAASLLVAAPAFAADAYKVDPMHAWAVYQVANRPGTNEMGNFEKISGEIVLDKADPSKSSVKIEITTASLHTGFAQRDKDLSSPDFFNVAEFPTMTFVSTKVEKTGEKTAKVTGDFTLLGVTRPVTLDVIYYGEKPLAWDAKTLKAGFQATGSIKPAEFGMKKFGDYGFGPDANLMLEIDATRPAS